MRSNCLAAFLAASLLGLVTPVFAGDQPDPFATSKPVSFGILHNHAAYAPLPPEPAPVPAPAPPQSSGKQLTRTGTVLKWVGVGCMAQGGLNIIVGAATPGERGIWIGSGAAFAAVGAALFYIGIHKTE